MTFVKLVFALGEDNYHTRLALLVLACGRGSKSQRGRPTTNVILCAMPETGSDRGHNRSVCAKKKGEPMWLVRRKTSLRRGRCDLFHNGNFLTSASCKPILHRKRGLFER